MIGDLGLDPRWLEAASGTMALAWAAIVFFMPDDLANHPGYVAAAAFLPDPVWVCLCVIGGSAQVWAARINHRLARLPFAAGSGIFWTLQGIGVHASTLQWSPSWPVFMMLGAWNWLASVVLVSRLMWRR